MNSLTTALLLIMLLSGCGQTGDLYWPADEQTVVEDDDPDAG